MRFRGRILLAATMFFVAQPALSAKIGSMERPLNRLEMSGIRENNAQYDIAELRMVVFGIEGAIAQGDASALEEKYALVRANSSDFLRLVVDSPGGDLFEAFKIGQWVRAKNIDIIVPLGRQCSSACVFILAAGMDKTVEGRVGIHRPYFSESGGSVNGTYLKQILSNSKQYLESMNIPGILAEDLFSIEPENVKYLTKEELGAYRLNKTDFVKKEDSDLRIASTLGISRAQLFSRYRKAKEKCEILKYDEERYFTCYSDVLKNGK